MESTSKARPEKKQISFLERLRFKDMDMNTALDVMETLGQ